VSRQNEELSPPPDPASDCGEGILSHGGRLVVRFRCRGNINVAEPGAACRSCGPVIKADDLGIRMLAESDEPWGEMPRRVVDAVRTALSAEQLIDAMLDGDDPWPVELQRQLLHPASGAAATLAEPRPGATVLDLGTGWLTLPVALGSFGTSVVVADWVYTRLRLGRLLHSAPGALCVHVALGGELPWADGSFDVVFVDVQEIERLCEVRGDAPEVKQRVLAEVRRVLRDDGVAVLGTGSRLRAALRRIGGNEVAPHRWRHLVEACRAARSPWWDSSLHKAGLLVSRVVIPYPRRDGWRWLIPGQRLRNDSLPFRGARGRAVRFVLYAGWAKWLVHDYYVLARPDASSRSPVQTLSQTLLPAGEPPPVTMALSDARVAVLGQRDFIKVPLSPDQQRAVAAEVAKTDIARRTAFAPFVIPGGRMAQWRGVPYSIYPALAAGPSSAAAVQEVVHAALSALDASAVAPLQSTVYWHRLTGARGRRDAEEIGAAELRAAVLEGGGERLVPVGPTHGDLHNGNVLVPESGHPLLVDWNRFELMNPLLLDAVYAAIKGHQSAGKTTLAQAFLAFVDGDLTGPVAGRAASLLGELGALEAATVVLLDRIVSYSLPRRRHKPWTMPPLQETVLALSVRQGGWRIPPASPSN
jgi:SAM-dependent methyltransferase